MPIINYITDIIVKAVFGKFIKDNLPSLHVSNIIAGLKKLRDYGLAFIALLLVRAKVNKLSNSELLALVLILILAVLTVKMNEQNKLKTGRV